MFIKHLKCVHSCAAVPFNDAIFAFAYLLTKYQFFLLHASGARLFFFFFFFAIADSFCLLSPSPSLVFIFIVVDVPSIILLFVSFCFDS